MKQKIIIILSIVVSFFINVFNAQSIMNNAEIMIQILFSILGLALTVYSLIFVPLQNKLSTDEETRKDLIRKILKEYQDDLQLIFWACVIIIIIEIILSINFPFIKNPQNIDFGLFCINSLKHVMFKTIQCVLVILSIYSLYDLMKATFILLEHSIMDNN